MNAFQRFFRIYSRSAYATIGTAVNLSALSILLKEKFGIDNRLGLRGRGSKTFNNSVSFRVLYKGAKMHAKIFSTGTLHISGPQPIQNAFEFVANVVLACHALNEDPDISVLRVPSSFGLKEVRVVMIYSVYHHPQRIDCEKAYALLRSSGMNAMYDIKLHRALNVRLCDREGTFLIFTSGKVIMTGGTSVEKYEHRWREVHTLIDQAMM